MVYFNHGIRPAAEIKRDTAVVKKLSSLTGFPCRFVKIKIPKSGASLENKARAARYKALAEIAAREGFDTILTAHTSDDNAETVIMRLMRGSGVKGLGGILPESFLSADKNIRLVRPLIFFKKKEILDYLKKIRFRPSADYTNRDEKYLRNAVRHRIIPLLERFNPRVREHLNNLARIMKEVSDYIEEKADNAYKDCVVRSTSVGKSRGFLDLERFFRYNIVLRRAILSRWLHEPNDFEAIESVHNFLSGSRRRYIDTGKNRPPDFSRFSICGFTIAVKKGSRAFLL